MPDEIKPPALLLRTGHVVAGARMLNGEGADWYELVRDDGAHVLVPAVEVVAVFLPKATAAARGATS